MVNLILVARIPMHAPKQNGQMGQYNFRNIEFSMEAI